MQAPDSILQPTSPHRPLPSFPTRRSSDLPARQQREGEERARAADAEDGAQKLVGILDCCDVLMAAIQDAYQLLSRSEEHTSELQSRLHLVCRLLLEKKNSSMTSWITT